MQSVFIRNITNDLKPKIISELRQAPGFIDVIDFPEKDVPSETMLLFKLQDGTFENFKIFAEGLFPSITIQEGVTL